MLAVLEVELVKGFALEHVVPMPRAPDVFVQCESLVLALAGFLHAERVESAQNGPVLVDGAMLRSFVEKETALLAAVQGHDELASSAAFEPCRIVFFHPRDLIGVEKLEELPRVGPGVLDDPDHVPGCWQTNNVGAAMTAVVAFEANSVFSHGGVQYLTGRDRSTRESDRAYGILLLVLFLV